MRKLISFVILLFAVYSVQAQLELCSGNSGDPIFTETFGTGTTNTPLPDGTTTFDFVNTNPFDGEYTVSSNSAYFDWHNIEDHTPNDSNGKMLIVNADFEPGEFYRTTITGLCELTTYEFSAWLINLLPSSGCGGDGISINIHYEIWDSTDTIQLAIGATGSIENTEQPIWRQFALLFQTEINQSSVILKLKNHGVGGCGNDLAIDDIVFKTCGDKVIIEDSSAQEGVLICEAETPFMTQLKAIPNSSIFSTHFYQWQESIDGINWINILGENGDTLNTPPLLNTTFFRVLVAENLFNIDNNFCNSASEVFEFRVINTPIPVSNNGEIILCENDSTPISVAVPEGFFVDWYDTPTSGNLLDTNNNNFSPNGISGTYYAEAVSTISNCTSSSRTPISVTYIESPKPRNDTLFFCENTEITLSAKANIPNINYLWSTGATSQQIDVKIPGIYSVEIDNNGCKAMQTFNLYQLDDPIIETIYSEGKNIVVMTSNSGSFEYSIDGNNYQQSNIFSSVDGGLYSIFVKEISCATIITKEFLHFFVPKFFTPNNDGYNDTFDLRGLEFFGSSQVTIFNRFGKLLKRVKNSSFSWDGMYLGRTLPSDDYWYEIIIEGEKILGHFTLRR